MLRVRCRVAQSTIPHAGMGLFAEEPIPRGTVIEVPVGVERVYSRAELFALPSDSPELLTSIRWLDDCYVADPQRSDTYYINHSFEPNCLWHLGFTFAMEDIPAGAEITIDYRVLMDADPDWAFVDASTGRRIQGFTWEEKMVYSAGRLLSLFQELAQRTTPSWIDTVALATGTR